jgi:hypothetical protein
MIVSAALSTASTVTLATATPVKVSCNVKTLGGFTMIERAPIGQKFQS